MKEDLKIKRYNEIQRRLDSTIFKGTPSRTVYHQYRYVSDFEGEKA